jgi:hypothetical protein
MAQPSEETKKSAASMAFGRLSKTALASAKKTISTVGKLFTKKPDNLVDESSPPTKIMGEIYKMMKLMDLDRKLNQEAANSHIEEQGHMRDKRNKEIIKALTTPKIKKPRVVKPKKVKTQETETTPLPPVNKTPGQTTTQPSKPPTKPPATPPKTESPAPAKTTAPKTETPAPAKTTAPKTETPAPAKTMPPKTAEPAKEIAGPPKPTAAPAKKTTAPPAQTVTPPPQTAAPASTITAPSASTAAKVGVGVAIAGASSMSLANEIGNKIATHESGKTQDSYDIMNYAGKGDKEYNKYKLTNMTIGEVLALAEERRKQFNKPNAEGKLGSIGVASGKYQFVPKTLKGTAEQVFGPNYLQEKFSPENQEKLHDRLFKNDILRMKSLGVPISEATIYMAHFLGPDGAAKLYFASDNTPMSEVMTAQQQQANQKLSQLTVGEYKSRITTNEGQRQALSNKEIDKERLNSFLQTAQNQKGERIKTASVQGQDLKKDMATQQEKMQAQQTTNILAQASTEPQVNLTKPKDSNPLLDKVRAG